METLQKLKEKTTTELQALAYQNLVQIQALQNGLVELEKEIALRQQEESKEK